MRHRYGFTLIEALAATALAAIMMAAVISIISAIARHDNLDDTNTPSSDWRGQLIGVIKRDLQHATHFHSQDNKLTLTGHVSLDSKTLKPTHRPAIVSYEINKYADQSWLVRTQIDPDSRALNNAWTQLICSGVQGLAVVDQPRTTGAITSREPQIDEDAMDSNPTPETLPVPVETVTLSLIWANPDQPASSTTLLIR